MASSQPTVMIKGNRSVVFKIISLVLYPPTSPIGNALLSFAFTISLASKTFNLDSSLTVRKAIIHMVDQVKSGLSASHAGLFVPERNLWLDENKPLIFYQSLLQQVDGVEFKGVSLAVYLLVKTRHKRNPTCHYLLEWLSVLLLLVPFVP